MQKDSNIVLNIKLDIDVFTHEAASKLLIEFIKFLLFQRNQIPYEYKTFEYFTSKPTITEGTTYKDFQKQKKILSAKNTLASIEQLLTYIEKEMSECIKGSRILFGSTAFTPREAYIINFPMITSTHSSANHKKAFETSIKAAMMAILTSEELFSFFSANLHPTNMFLSLLIESNKTTESETNSFGLKEFVDVPLKCKTCTINIVHHQIFDAPFNFCKEIFIYNDPLSLNVCENKSIKKDLVTANYVFESKIVIKGLPSLSNDCCLSK